MLILSRLSLYNIKVFKIEENKKDHMIIFLLKGRDFFLVSPLDLSRSFPFWLQTLKNYITFKIYMCYYFTLKIVLLFQINSLDMKIQLILKNKAPPHLSLNTFYFFYFLIFIFFLGKKEKETNLLIYIH